MRTYFFHLSDGVDVLRDEEGRALAGDEAAVTTALAEARGIIGADALAGEIALDQRIDVEDEQGMVVHSLEFEDAVRVKRGLAVPSGQSKTTGVTAIKRDEPANNGD